MKRNLIATIVGTVILFVYQGVSWSFLPTHKDSFKYTTAQDTILAALSANLTEEGLYLLPSSPPGTSMEDKKKHMEAMAGKPYATVQYHPTCDINEGKTMSLGVIINLLAVAIVVWLVSKAGGTLTTFGSRFTATLCFGLFLVLQSQLMRWNWLHVPTHYITGEIIDSIVGWALCGIWLGWFLGRKPKTTSV